MKRNYLIQKRPNEKVFLDGWNGGEDWEWSGFRSTSWRFTADEADRRLKQLLSTFPDAFIVLV